MSVTIDDAIASKKHIEKRMKALEQKMKEINQEKMTLWKALAKVNIHLKKKCEHEWRRESYLYAPLCCVKCGVQR